jgi:sialate O-acetylesterase
MLQLWRDSWGRGDMPFIYALLAPYHHGDSDGRWRPFFVEAQMRMASETTNAWYVCTETLGDPVTIHPPYKREVADMMELTALQNVYGIPTGISIEPARLKEWNVEEDGTVKVRLTNVWSNLGSISSRDVVGFELAGEDREFHLAKAEIDWDGETIIVRCPEVSKPVAVRYGFRNWMGANLAKSSGIPVPPFRSDDWEY